MYRHLAVMLLLLTPLAGNAVELPPGVLTVTDRLAPDLKLDNLDGEPYDLAGSSGHWRFVHFWASWCGPCRREMPSIQQMIPQLEGSGIEFVLVNTAQTDDEAFTFLGIVAPELIPLMDYDGLVTEAWQPRGLPATYLVDPAGHIRYQALGGRPWEQPQYLEFLRALPDPATATATGNR